MPNLRTFYLKGRYYFEKRTPDGLNNAVDFFTQAIVHDPAYRGAVCWAGGYLQFAAGVQRDASARGISAGAGGCQQSGAIGS
jgi:hypothetical protein